MSITFSLEKHSMYVHVKNEEFNKYDPEDSMFNPRFVKESMYPSINVSNSNAFYLLKTFEIVENINSNNYYYGTIELKKLYKLLEKFQKIENSLLWKKDKDITDDLLYVSRKINKFDRLVRYAIALNDNITWG